MLMLITLTLTEPSPGEKSQKCFGFLSSAWPPCPTADKLRGKSSLPEGGGQESRKHRGSGVTVKRSFGYLRNAPSLHLERGSQVKDFVSENGW